MAFGTIIAYFDKLFFNVNLYGTGITFLMQRGLKQPHDIGTEVGTDVAFGTDYQIKPFVFGQSITVKLQRTESAETGVDDKAGTETAVFAAFFSFLLRQEFF